MDLRANLDLLHARMRAACSRSGRDPVSVALLAVTKSQPPDAVNVAAQLGLILFGENKIQEAKSKIPLCPGKLRWHFIGHLQSNKCRDAVECFEMVQSVDSLALARELNKKAELASRRLPILLEINVAGEASKFGYSPERVLAELKEINALPRLEIQGLMCVPPWAADPEKARPHFRRLVSLKAQCEQILGAPLPHLSMGMTTDFEAAIEEGATLVRVGTGLFGSRKTAKVA